MIPSGDLAMEEMPFDSKRRLCPDGACVGVLGADGRCSVCQRPAGAGATWAAEVEADGKDTHHDEAGEDDEAGASMSHSASPSDLSSSFDSKRRLCDDGSCVGIVGADGVCGTCGRRAE
jgi:hypothetical protein